MKCPDAPGTLHHGGSRVGDRSAVCVGDGVGTKQNSALSINSAPPTPTCTHMHAHTCTHTCTCARVHIQTHVRAHTPAHTCTHVRAHSCKCACMHANTHMLVRAAPCALSSQTPGSHLVKTPISQMRNLRPGPVVKPIPPEQCPSRPHGLGSPAEELFVLVVALRKGSNHWGWRSPRSPGRSGGDPDHR